MEFIDWRVAVMFLSGFVAVANGLAAVVFLVNDELNRATLHFVLFFGLLMLMKP